MLSVTKSIALYQNWKKIFTTASGSNLQLTFQGITFQGTIINSIQKYSNLRSALIKADNFNGTILGISKRTNTDNSITYVGRILNDQYADGYELKSDANGNYFLNKIKLDELLQDK